MKGVEKMLADLPFSPQQLFTALLVVTALHLAAVVLGFLRSKPSPEEPGEAPAPRPAPVPEPKTPTRQAPAAEAEAEEPSTPAMPPTPREEDLLLLSPAKEDEVMPEELLGEFGMIKPRGVKKMKSRYVKLTKGSMYYQDKHRGQATPKEAAWTQLPLYGNLDTVSVRMDPPTVRLNMKGPIGKEGPIDLVALKGESVVVWGKFAKYVALGQVASKTTPAKSPPSADGGAEATEE